MGLFAPLKGRSRPTMGISRDSLHKRRAAGGKQKPWRKKRKYELGRQPANTKLSSNVTVRQVRCRGGNIKHRALRLDTGNFRGAPRTARVKRVSWTSCTTRLITNSFVRRRSRRARSSPSTWRRFARGTPSTTARRLVSRLRMVLRLRVKTLKRSDLSL